MSKIRANENSLNGESKHRRKHLVTSLDTCVYLLISVPFSMLAIYSCFIGVNVFGYNYMVDVFELGQI